MEIVVVGNIIDQVRYWQELPQQFQRELRQLLDYWARQVIAEARRRSRRVSGELVQGFYYTITSKSSEEIVAAIENSSLHLLWTEYGTGVFSEADDSSHAPITAKGRSLKIPIGKFRSFRSAPNSTQAFEIAPNRKRAGTAFLFRKSILGQRPQHILENLLEDFTSRITQDIIQLANRYGFY